jgi:hypothetical protein
LGSVWLAKESSSGPVLVSAGFAVGGAILQGRLRPIDFQLGTNEAHLTENRTVWQMFLQGCRLAEQYGASFAGWEEGQMAGIAVDVLILCTRMRACGALVHIWRASCNTAATGAESLANDLTGGLSQ